MSCVVPSEIVGLFDRSLYDPEVATECKATSAILIAAAFIVPLASIPATSNDAKSPDTTSPVAVTPVLSMNLPTESSQPMNAMSAADPVWYLIRTPRSLLSSEPGAVSPPSIMIGSSTDTVVALMIVLDPFTNN